MQATLLIKGRVDINLVHARTIHIVWAAHKGVGVPARLGLRLLKATEVIKNNLRLGQGTQDARRLLVQVAQDAKAQSLIRHLGDTLFGGAQHQACGIPAGQGLAQIKR